MLVVWEHRSEIQECSTNIRENEKNEWDSVSMSEAKGLYLNDREFSIFEVFLPDHARS